MLKQHDTIFRNEFTPKMAITCFLIMCELSNGESLDLGSFGSHTNEQFIGCMKWKLKNFETDARFIQYCRRMLVSRPIRDDLWIPFSLPKTMSDFRAKLETALESVPEMDLDTPLATATCFVSIALESDAIPDVSSVPVPSSIRWRPFSRNTISTRRSAVCTNVCQPSASAFRRSEM